MKATNPPPCAVLDTNVVLDWLVFADPSCRALGAAITAGRLRWLATYELRAEFEEVLDRGVGAARRPDRTALGAIWCSLAEMHPPAKVLAAAVQRPPCRCTDPDDQKFIDLALHTRAAWLLSRDRAVLELAREARSHGLGIIAPAAWSALEPISLPP